MSIKGICHPEKYTVAKEVGAYRFTVNHEILNKLEASRPVILSVLSEFGTLYALHDPPVAFVFEFLRITIHGFGENEVVVCPS